ncbi:hypothetical protein FKM82_022563 [Ascaphus truei]
MASIVFFFVSDHFEGWICCISSPLTFSVSQIFGAPSFDDKILEVVAVFGSMQMAVSRVIKLQHHRIAQCRSVKITILGEEGVPVQVDGEAWIQPPGVIKIVHKNRAQMLTRDRVSLVNGCIKLYVLEQGSATFQGTRAIL